MRTIRGNGVGGADATRPTQPQLWNMHGFGGRGHCQRRGAPQRCASRPPSGAHRCARQPWRDRVKRLRTGSAVSAASYGHPMRRFPRRGAWLFAHDPRPVAHGPQRMPYGLWPMAYGEHGARRTERKFREAMSPAHQCSERAVLEPVIHRFIHPVIQQSKE